MALLPTDDDALSRLVAIAQEGGRIAHGFFRAGQLTEAEVRWKGDGSPVTHADLAVNTFLEGALADLWPTAAWLSEESTDDDRRLENSDVIIVDPIDGTRGFARGDPQWAVAIALVRRGRPVCAVVHAPALAETYAATAGRGATLNGKTLKVRADAELREDLRVSCPAVLAKALRAAGVNVAFQPKIASLALRIAKVASGVYDAGVTTSNSNDWDIAASDLILTEAGGLLAGLDGASVTYNRPDPTHGVLMACAPGLRPHIAAALARTPFGR